MRQAQADSAISAVSASPETPIQGRTSLPPLASRIDDARDHVDGMAKPMPTLPPVFEIDRGVDADQLAVQCRSARRRNCRD